MAAPISNASARCEHVIAKYAHDTPSDIALIEGDQVWTYTDLHNAVEECASGLLAHGVNVGDRVATLAAPDADFVITFLAAVSVGAIWQGLNPRYQRQELAYAVKDSQPKLIFAPAALDGRRYLDELKAAALESGHQPEFFDLNTGLENFHSLTDVPQLKARRSELNADDPALIVYTSGSTGAPKGALLKHRAIVDMSLMQNRVWPVSKVVALNFLPVNHVGNLVDITMPVFAAGGTLVLMPRFDPDASLALMETHGVTIWGSIPSVFQLQLASPRLEETDLSAVELIVWEGAAMPADSLPALRKVCRRMATNYGMTETTSAVTIVSPTDDVDVLTQSVGAPVDGVELRVAAPDNTEVQPGEIGEIQTRSDFNTLGYWQRPEATKDAFTEDGFFKTGDLGVLRPDGRLQIVGRLKEMYKSGGYNVYPREIESILEQHTEVLAASVVGVSHSLWGEVGVAFVIGSRSLTEQDLEDWARSQLANYKVPKLFQIVSELPLLPIGKVDKSALREIAADLVG